MLYRIFGTRNARTVNLWCEDPKCTAREDGAYDPISGVKALFDELDSYGHVGVVRSCITYLVSDTSVGVNGELELVEPRPTIAEEILLDYKAVAELQAAIDAAREAEHIVVLKNAAIAEIERTVAKYASMARSNG